MSTETAESAESVEETSPLEMSDEAFAEVSESNPVVHVESANDEVVKEVEEDTEEETEDEDLEVAPEADASDNSDSDSDSDDSGDDLPVVDVHSDSGSAESTEPVEEDSETAINYEAEYNKLMAPFKANGKDMNVKNVDDAIQLMQMGAGYNRKMAALKPNMALLKMLEKNELLDESKLSFLIDVNKKDPTAIAKLVKDAGLEPLEMDLEKDQYKPNNYAVNATELDLDNVIEEIRDTPSFSKTLNSVDAWDINSKQAVANDPQLLRVLNAQVESGVYDLISTTVESERMYGRLQGLSDIQAYQTVGDAIQARNGFDHLFNQGQQSNSPAKSTAKKGNDEGRKDKRRKASPTKQSAPAKAPNDYNPLNMSDEEFLKQGDSKFL